MPPSFGLGESVEKQSLEIWQLLLPIVYGFLEIVVLSQTYVRTLTGVALRVIRDPAPGGSDPVDNSRRAYTTSAVIEMLRFFVKNASRTKSSSRSMDQNICSSAIFESPGWWDVVSGLGKALQKKGHLVEIVLLKYDCMQYDHVCNLRALTVPIKSYFDHQ
ncbi:uncharacterized protein LOC111240861 isoform X4 [Vigna radiata var. radiata]|uniref:Uncharacterized protein LOC111240861 isoform X4 n=1 Tax=Vigna radiata var. radiata TaxID=3916 RepID=A0A3Q0EKN9_VIGRR|nr:uncharacterized protein LOC111240861 isoform X4 [Vigna radiata var. radiata]